MCSSDLTLGSPYLLQLVGHYLCLKGQPGTELGREEVDAALALSRSDFETDVCRTTLNALSEVDINFLVSMSEDQGSGRISDIAARLGVSRDYAQKYRKRLIGAGVIQPAGLLADGADHAKRERARFGMDAMKELKDVLGGSFTLLDNATRK